MNVILLLFVVLSAMFASAAVNNIIAVTGGIDYYFEKAGMADYYIFSHDSDGRNEAEELLFSKQQSLGLPCGENDLCSPVNAIRPSRES